MKKVYKFRMAMFLLAVFLTLFQRGLAQEAHLILLNTTNDTVF